MAKYAKWIGGGLGWAFAGPLGGVLGFAIGSMFDNVNDVEYEHLYRSPHAKEKTQTGDFSASLLVLAAAVMKADGKVLKSELDFVRRFFVQQFGAEKTREQMLVLKEVLKQDLPLREICVQIRHFTQYPDRLQLLHFLFGIAGADKHFDPSELSVVGNISNLLGISSKDFTSIRAMFVKDVESDYKILEIAASASDEEVKRAYRKMANKYHPDKVGHLGEEFRQMAKDKFQKVQNAYENIRKLRGMN